MVNRHSLALGTVLALGAGTFYGTVPVLTRFAFQDGVPAIETIAFRTFCVGLILTVSAAALGHNFHVPRSHWAAFAGQTLATFAVSTCYLLSVQFVPVGIAVVIFFTFPLIIGLLAPLIEGGPLSRSKLICSVIAFAGLVIAVGPSVAGTNLTGILLASTAAVGCAFQFFTGRKLAQSMTPAAFGGLVHLLIWPFVMLVAASLTPEQFQVLPGGDALASGMLAAAGVAVVYLAGYTLHMMTLSAAPSSIVAPFFNVEPIVSTVLAFVLLGERLSLLQYAGAALVLGAIIFTPFADRKRDPA
jgi:drug/metabolite transporter (DMT)-like permease